MKGTILDFSVQTNTGIISGEDAKRYQFIGSEWKEATSPQRGQIVDYDINEQGQAIAIYFELKTTFTPTQYNTEPSSKNEDVYNLFDWFIKCIKNYANFNGRARRKEYWFFRLSMLIISISASFIDAILETEILFIGLFILATFIPDLAVSVRRLHDINKSGWWYLITLIPIFGIILLIIWLAKEGDQHNNMYGESPK
ncbi:DUF805 domain-containing protein [Acinetobacter gerneri]|uniref:Inner membrane protein yhaI n=1 Tax=Acinetobacter gerneri DSM 14967 = CIP 107464 = MTCC 9824 TaxID=1120926 RepID=N8Y948_9GAMM|nr:DUF805 domain-containing protein [Acinetobacter gerneri]ENV33292.1 hypothetical protein F960_02319 [Acinetobacter gerneri DSM 14967 = CIP 107464 = MTCC 9824]EPR81342.1 Integral membrane protein [Acinetobacter gerneri DSM 14967 = CIP 107464 = MTCC 9824]